jgi:hypothetical protein
MPIEDYRCINENLNLTVLSSINTATDFAVVLVPIPLTLSLQMSRKQRNATLGLFLMAGGVCFVGIARCVLIARIIGRTYDLTWEAYPLWIVTGMEAYIGVILVSLPSLRPLLSEWLPGFCSFGISNRSYASHSHISSGLPSYKRRNGGWRDQHLAYQEEGNNDRIELSTHELSSVESRGNMDSFEIHDNDESPGKSSIASLPKIMCSPIGEPRSHL